MPATTDPVTEPATPAVATPAASAPAVDVQAQINAALAVQQADFAKQLQETTGHADLKALSEANLKAQGKLQELADNKTQEAQAYKTRFEQAAINNAVLTAAVDALDPSVITALLAGQAACDDHGTVTIGGKPVSDAVKALLAEKPFLAKAQGGTGSGAPSVAPISGADKGRDDNLNPLERLKAARQSGVK